LDTRWTIAGMAWEDLGPDGRLLDGVRVFKNVLA